MTWDYYNTGEDEIEKYDLDYATGADNPAAGTPAEIYVLLASMAALGVTLMFTDEDFIAGRKKFVEKLRSMYKKARAKVKRKGD